MTVPGFPNFFMLYGPNRNLGHNSIVYMLESQFAHVLRCLRALKKTGAVQIEVETAPYRAFNAGIQASLARSAWAGCRSWYLAEQGRNTANWPGFTLTYRWLAKHASLKAYRFARPGAAPGELRVLPPPSRLETFLAAQNRLLLRAAFKPLVGPPLSLPVQRRIVDLLSVLMPATGKVKRERRMLVGVPAEMAVPVGAARAEADSAVLYLLGDAQRLAAHARACGVPCRLEVFEQRWHVFQLQAAQLHGARSAIEAVAGFARERLQARPESPTPRRPRSRSSAADPASAGVH